ncbi:MarR family winged helix-turn-helix transcriptional regulator [Catellatospora citrea]|uniref:MarR family transcriptional regulator n=1 Tax=Catellatospora citrea TaxID=53366 RepID=A0A8J3KJ30_9ACTN|nr:MarR family transcriptional regulator [Catellatospora citrea]RKE05554.1 DNA-binding MarR family transcriptional regulator [Catellatospora citrea]GIF96904.1 MarR family transcriptional regulator [Catellatospora citrea]
MADEFAEQVVQRIYGVRRVLRRRLSAAMTLPPFTGSQVDLLRLVESSAGIGVSAAAQQLHLAANSVSTMVNQLGRSGYLRREPDPKDRRAARLFLTGQAIERLAGWRDARAQLLGAGLAALTPQDRQALARALPALGRLADAIAEVSDD